MRIELRGINKLLSEIHRKQKTEQEAKGVVKEHTAAMHQKAVNDAPVDTGYLKRNITQKIEDGGLTGIVISEALNGGFTYSYIQEFGGRFITPQPYMRPAFYGQKDLFIDDLKRLVKR